MTRQEACRLAASLAIAAAAGWIVAACWIFEQRSRPHRPHVFDGTIAGQ